MKITVEFIGICTHVLVPIRGWRHRVVLPMPYRSNIPEHTPELLIPQGAASPKAIEEFIGTSGAMESLPSTLEQHHVSLKGVELTISNASGGYGTDEKFDRRIYKLTNFADGEDLGPPNHLVAVGRDRFRAHAYFNVNRGSFSATLHGRLSVAVLEVQTDGPPILKATSFENPKETKLELPDDVKIVVRHTKESHDNRHFILHYEVASIWPTIRRWPEEKDIPTDAEVTPAPAYGLGPGCSNSTFP